MTDEEMAEEYIMREDVVTENDRVPVDNGYGWQTVSFEDEVKRAYLDGLAEGRKEGFDEGYKKATERAYERQQDLTNTYIKDGEKIKQLEKENAELKEQNQDFWRT